MKRWICACVIAMCANEAAAQACLGVPSVDGQTAFAGEVGFPDGGKTYGAQVTANLRGPLSIFAGYDLIKIDDVDTSGNSFGGGIAFELSVPNVSICPGAGVTYTRFHDEEFGVEFTVSQIVVPIGLGIGKSLEVGPNLYLTLFGQPQFLYIRTSFDVDIPGESESGSESDNEFGTVLGVRLGSASFYGGAAVSLTTIEDSDPVFSISLGFLIGRR